MMIRYRAKNDVNGNPRRVYVLYRDGVAVASWDEGYAGYGAVPSQYRDMAKQADTVDVAVRTYRDYLKIPSAPMA